MWPCCGQMRLLQTFLLFIAPIYTYGQYRDGDIRLVGGSYQWEGRVEIYFSGTWSTITDSDWTSDDAQVVCHKLGHFKPGATAHSSAYFGEGSGLIQLTFVNCSGSQYDLTECETENVENSSSHSLDVGVKCQPADEAYREGDIRLVGGSYNWEGRVEIYWSGTWGAISDSSWTPAEASVVCRQLWLSDNGAKIPCCDIFGEGSGPIHIHNVTCVGSEAHITDCNYLNNTIITNHQQDVGVQCQQGDDIKEGDIRLVGGRYLWEGRVEIFLSGVWGTISDDGSTNTDAAVVCRQLGYESYNADKRCCAGFGQGTGPIHIDNLACSGSEYRLHNCQYGTDTSDESHDEDWSVYCNVAQPLFRCTVLHLDHPCLLLPDRGSNLTLPSILPVDTIIGENDIHTIFSVLRGSYPDSCLDVLERYLCILAAPPCDPKSNGLPMLFCEQDCVAYKILKEEGTCKSTIEFFREIAGTVGNKYLTRGIDILEKFDCNNVSTFYFFESDDYAETCTGLLSKQSKENTLNTANQPQCVPVTTSPCAAVFPQPYYIPVAGREENEIFAIVTKISDQLDPFCSNALNIFACYFIYPPCDPDRGTQMTLCEESCYVITDRCQSQFTSIEGSKFDGFFYPLYNFNCSSPESYLIPGFPPDMENCLQADDVVDIQDDSSSFSSNVVTLIFSVTTSLCLVIVMCLTILVILFVCNKSKMKKYYQKWKLSTNQRSRSHGVENPVELTDVKQAEQTIDNTPAIISNEDCRDEEEEVVKLSGADVTK